MANNTAETNQDFDEDLDEEFVDDFGTETLDSKDKNSFGAVSQPQLGGNKGPGNLKNIINLAVLGTITLSVLYFGYSYYKKSQASSKESAQKIQAPHDSVLPVNPTNLPLSTQPDKPIAAVTNTTANSQTNTPTQNKTLTGTKIEDLEFELNPLDKNLPTPAKNAQISTINNQLPSHVEVLTHSAKIEGLEQALSSDSAIVVNPVQDLFDNDVLNNTSAAKQASAKPHDDVKDTLASMAEEITLNVNHIHQLETTVTQINKTLDEVTQALSKLDSKLSTIGDTLKILDQDITNVKKVMSNQDLDLATIPNKISHQSTKDPVVYSTPDYVVHAIIPGRAWLKSTGGQIITITEGDQIDPYGKIASIDATNNLVRTSSGITFR